MTIGNGLIKPDRIIKRKPWMAAEEAAKII